MVQRAAQAAEPKPRRRDKAHEERLVLESALAREPVSARQLPSKPLTVECHEGRIPTDTAEHSDRPPRLLLRLLRKGVAVAEVQLDPALTVQEVKEGLAEKLGTAPQDQRFFWRMQCLPDYSSFQEMQKWCWGFTFYGRSASYLRKTRHEHGTIRAKFALEALKVLQDQTRGPSALLWRCGTFGSFGAGRCTGTGEARAARMSC